VSSPILSSTAVPAQDLAATAIPSGTDPKEAAKQFEGLLMANLFKEMRKTVHHSSLFGDGGTARSTYEYLLDQAVVNHAMDSGKTWGLSERLESSLRKASGK
jgi:Rod binding domain-containing protein